MPLYQVTLTSSGHRFLASQKQSLLKAGLQSGLNLKFGCENGSCGACLARLEKGELSRIRFSDYRLTEQQQSQGQFLSCCFAAAADCQVDMPEIGALQEIPVQRMETRVYRRQPLSPEIMSVTLKTPRSQHLSFLAGQYVTLCNAQGIQRNLSIASCPCQETKLEFHVKHRANDAFSDHVFSQLAKNDTLMVHGPWGEFVLDDDTVRPLLFIAFETGFAAINSLLEHVLALEKEQAIELYWILPQDNIPYLDNYCRSVEDAVDNFSYHPLTLRGSGQGEMGGIVEEILQRHVAIAQAEVYISLPSYRKLDRQFFSAYGLNAKRLHINTLADL